MGHMSGVVFFIGGKEKSNSSYKQFLEKNGFTLHCLPCSRKLIMEKLNIDFPHLLLVDYENVQRNCRSIQKFFTSLSKLEEFQSIPLVLLTRSGNVDLDVFAGMVDDVLVLPTSHEHLQSKSMAWSLLARAEKKTPLPQNQKRLSFLEYQVEKIRHFLRNGDLGQARQILLRVQEVLDTFPEKRTEAFELSEVLGELNQILEKSSGQLLLAKLNSLDFSLYQTMGENTLSKFEGQVSQKSQEALTHPMKVEDFLDVKEAEIRTQLANREEGSPFEDSSKSVYAPLLNSMDTISPRDAHFARRLLQRQVISKQQLIRSLEEQKELKVKGKPIPLCNVMLMIKVVIPEDIQRVFGKDAINSLFCGGCQTPHRVLNLSKQPPENFRCRICQQPLCDKMDESEMFILPEDDKLDEMLSDPLEVSVEPNRNNIPYLIERADFFSRSGQIRKAEHIYEEILSIFPDDEDCLLGLSRIFIENSSYERALEKVERVLSKNPLNNLALSHRGVAYYYTNQIDKSIADMSVLTEKRVHNFMSYSTRGKGYFRKKKYQEAINDLTRSIILAPDFTKGYIYRAKAYLHLGKHQLALHDFEEALKINPQYANAKEVHKMIAVTREKMEESSHAE